MTTHRSPEWVVMSLLEDVFVIVFGYFFIFCNIEEFIFISSCFLFAEGDFRIYVTTGNSGTTEFISLYVYGEKGQSGPIVLGEYEIEYQIERT